MLKIIKNKKGFTIGAIVLLVCFVIFSIVGFIFYLLYGFVGKLSVYDIGSDSGSLNSKPLLITYLRTPVKVDERIINMADLINLYQNDKKYKSILIEESEKILKSLPKPHPISGWNLIVHTMPEDDTLIKIKTLDIVGLYAKRKSYVNMPIKDDTEKYFKLELYLECQDVSCY